MLSITNIHAKLGLNLGNGLFIKSDIFDAGKRINELYHGDFSNFNLDFKTEYALVKLKPHSFFQFNNVPVLLFFEFTDLDITKQELSKRIWNFNKSALAFVNYSNELVIYNGFQYNRNSNLLQTLEVIKDIKDSKLKEYSYWQIVTAQLWNSRDEDFKKKTRVDTKLLENIKATRDILTDKNSPNRLIEKHANRIIGRLIFVRYLLDRKVKLDYEGPGKELLTKEGLPELILQKDDLFNFFEYLIAKFKGDILPLNGEQGAVKQKNLEVLHDLFAGQQIKTYQPSLFNVFDFDFIPIELISNIYETFLGKEKQDSDKVFYTPPFLVDYILEQTVKPFISDQMEVKNMSCKTVDFTCGSGIFLCETLRALINRYMVLDNPDRSSTEFKNSIKQLLVENIYGNDTNEEAIEIAKFSLFITLLDYFEDPKDIADFEFPDVSKNFFKADVFKTQLNSDNQFEGELDNVFGIGKQIEPDFIIGNPPWGKLYEESDYLKYLESRETKENEIKYQQWYKNGQIGKYDPVKIEISNKEFAQSFLFRLSDFSTEKTKCQIIVTSKVLYNLNAVDFRKYLLNNFLINEVLEISSVRHQIFTNAVGPAAIIKYQFAFGSNTQDNLIEYVSLKPNPYFAIFKTILIEKHDYKEVYQKELMTNDWLWKVLVYGHILDYRLIERLRSTSNYPLTIGDFIEDKNNLNRPLFASTGIKIGNKNKINDVSQYKGMYFIQTDTRKTRRPSDLQRFYTYFNNDNVWKENKADGARQTRLFKNPPAVLIKIGFSPNFKLIASIIHIECVFTNSIYAIKSKSGSYHILETLLGIVNSDLMSYYMLLCGSSLGVEREQLINEELFPFPFIENNQISSKVQCLIRLMRLIKLHKKGFPISYVKVSLFEELFKKEETTLNKLIFDSYNLSDSEKELISYNQEITIPILQAKNKKFKDIAKDKRLFKPYRKIKEPDIKNYIRIFVEHFSKSHSGGDSGFINSLVILSEDILAIEFKIEKQKKDIEWKYQAENDKALDLMASIGFEKVSNQLFIQKDIKVQSKRSFSVLKIRQYKYWHKAIARLDVVEFMEAMIESQKHNANVEG